MFGICRDEMDNCRKLAQLLDDNPGAIITAAAKEGETPFMLGPDIARSLRRKADTMHRHMLELDELMGWRARAPAANTLPVADQKDSI